MSFWRPYKTFYKQWSMKEEAFNECRPMSFPTKQKFIDYLTRFGWKCGYEGCEIWFCPECVKGK